MTKLTSEAPSVPSDLNLKILAKVLSVAVIGIVFAFGEHHMATSRGEMTKEDFQASQGQRYDKFYAKPRAPFFMIAILMTGAAVGVYELLAFGIYSAIKSGKDSKP